MSAVVFLLVALAGGMGAAARLLIDGLVNARVRGAYPLGTTVVNATGSLALGFLVGLALGFYLPVEWQLVLGTGFLGGYTTFSTASVETVRLLQNRRFGAALANGLGMLLLCVGASGLGLWLGLLL